MKANPIDQKEETNQEADREARQVIRPRLVLLRRHIRRNDEYFLSFNSFAVVYKCRFPQADARLSNFYRQEHLALFAVVDFYDG